VFAVAVAEHGLDAAPDSLEHPSGFFALYGEPRGIDEDRFAQRLEHWRQNWPRDWSLKRYPCCYGTHRSIDAIVRLRTEIDPADVESIQVWASPRSLRPLLDRPPATGVEAKFSLPYTVATALLHGPPTVTDFTDSALDDPEVAGLMNRVRVVGRDRPELGAYALVRVRLTSGGTAERLVRHTRGDARNPLTDAELDDKYRAAVGRPAVGRPADELPAVLRRALTEAGARAKDVVMRSD